MSDEIGPNYTTKVGYFSVTENGKPVTVLTPEKRLYTVQNAPMTEAAIRAGLVNDLYVSLGDQISEQAWAVRIYIKPFVQWIWVGCLMMAAGGFLAMVDPRYRRMGKTGSDQESV